MTSVSLAETRTDFFDQLAEDIGQARRRVLLQTMSVDRGGLEHLGDSLATACRRGAYVHFVYDRYSFFDIWTKEGRSGVKELKRSLGDLAMRGVVMIPVGLAKINPFAGRHHIKTYIVDDVVYAGGGANLTRDTQRTADFMVRYESLPETADRLFDQLPKMALRRFRGETLPFTKNASYLVDGGRPGESLIYDTATAIMQKADRSIIVSKMVPDGELVRHAPSETEFYYNKPEHVGRFNRLSLRYSALSGSLPPNSYDGDIQLHAKACVVENGLGRTALSGSHNYNMLGVRFGTQESALLTTDNDTIDLIADFIHRASDTGAEGLPLAHV